MCPAFSRKNKSGRALTGASPTASLAGPGGKRWRRACSLSSAPRHSPSLVCVFGPFPPTDSQVWSARDKQTNELVALKKVRMESEREGFPLTAIREIKLLKTLHHDNIVALKEIVTGNNGSAPGSSIYLVFEYMDHDLTGLMDTPSIRFEEQHIKCYMLQLLRGLQYCHDRQVLHRDIKGSNLLIDNHGCLKIADLGLARSCGEDGRRYTNRVITLWYRPPELLLGANEYDMSVDMWSVGCLIAELLTRKPLFPGKDEAEQTSLIFQMVGTPTHSTWPNWRDLPQARIVPESPRYPPGLARHFMRSSKNVNDSASDLIQKLLTLDPSKRLTATEALDHAWFRTEPVACAKGDLPKFAQSTHEFQAKRRRQAAGPGK
jgi:cyclin-dependent kinase 12/13